MKSLRKHVALGAAAFAALASGAGECTWTGLGETTAWSDSGNWASVPAAEDTLVVGTKVTATAADITWANGYAGLKLDGADSEVMLSPLADSVTMTVPLSGDGRFASTNASINGKYLSLKNDNRAFTGPFYFDRVGVSMCHPHCFGHTNEVMVQRGNNNAYFQAKYNSGAGNDYSNRFVFGHNTYTYFNPSGGIHFSGLVDVRGFVQLLSDTSIGYATKWDCLVTNTVNSTDTFRFQQYQVIDENGVFDLGKMRLQVFGGYLYVHGLINSCSSFVVENATVTFYRTNAVKPGLSLRFGTNGVYPRQAKYNLNGFDQECGAFYVRNSDMNGNAHAYTDVRTTAQGQPDGYIKSPVGQPAAFTVRGTYSCDPDNGNYTMAQRRRMIYPIMGSASLVVDTATNIATAAEMRLSSAYSDTDGGIVARRGKIVIESTARMPNLTKLEATDEGIIEIESGAVVGTEGTGLTVSLADGGTLTIGEGVTFTARTARVNGEWLGADDYTSSSDIPGLTGAGTLHVETFGGTYVPFEGIVLDGRIGSNEWDQAAIYDGMRMAGTDETFPVETKTYVIRDTTNLYVAVKSLEPSVGITDRVMPKRYGQYAHIDDTVTFALSGGRRLAVNSRGAFTTWGWTPSADVRYASTVEDGYWTFEFIMPIAEAGDLASFDVGRHWPMADPDLGTETSVALASGIVPALDAPRVQVLSVNGGQTTYTVKVRVVSASAESQPFTLECSGQPENSQPTHLTKSGTLSPGESRTYTMTGAILDDELVSLTVGPRTVGVRPNYAGDPFVAVGDDSDLVAYKFAYYPSYNQFRARADVSNVSDFREVVKGLACVLTNAEGSVVFARTNTVIDADGVLDETFAVPDLRPLTAASGNAGYGLTLTVLGLKKAVYAKNVYRYAMHWEGNTYGLSETVVPPFTAMEVEDNVVRTILREHELNSVGLFRQVKCPACEGATAPTKPILAGEGMRLLATVGGEEFAVTGTLLVAASSSPVSRTMRADFDQNGFRGHADIVFEYDGQMAWTLTMEAGELDALKIVIPYLEAEATHMHGMPESLRGNYGGLVPAGSGSVWNGSLAPVRLGVKGDYLSYLWIGGTLRGLSVYGESDLGWVHFEGWPLADATQNPVHCQDVVRDGDGTVKLILNLVQKPFAVTEDRTIRLFFMATPVKPMLANWRQMSFGHFLGSGSQWGAAPQDADVEPFDHTGEVWDKMSETRDTGVIDEAWLAEAFTRMPLPGNPGETLYESTKAHNEGHLRSGFENMKTCRRNDQMVWYTNARGVDYGIPSGTTYCDEWNLNEFLDLDRDFTMMSKRDYALDPNRAFQDYAGWWYRRMVTSGACDSLYWDDIYLKANYDLVGTDSYRLADGRIQPATGVSNMRALIKRCATVQAECGKNATNNWIHMTDTAIAPVSAFAGVHYDMEDSPASGKAFQQKYPMAYLEAVSIGRQMGARVKVIAHYESSTDEKDAWYERTGAGMMLAYEFGWKWNAWQYNSILSKLKTWGYRASPDVRVWNYWNADEAYPVELACDAIAIDARGRATGTTDGVASIAMALNGEAIVVVTDFSGVGGTVRVKPDKTALGLSDGCAAYDFEAAETTAYEVENGEVLVPVEPYNFRMVILK